MWVSGKEHVRIDCALPLVKHSRYVRIYGVGVDTVVEHQ